MKKKLVCATFASLLLCNESAAQIRDTTAHALGNVNVYGKSKTQRIKEGAYTVNALDIKSIASSINNVADLVNRSSGIKIRTEGGLGSDFDLSLNGMSGNSIKYFVDGVPMSTLGSNISLQNIPVNTVDRVEIYKGVVPAYLGTDALGGAINIITKQNKHGNFVDASISAGSFGTYIAEVNAKYVVPKIDLIVHPMFSYKTAKNDYKVKDVKVWSEEDDKYIYTTRRRFHDGYTSVIAQMELGIENKKWADAFFVSASYTNVDKELQTGATQDRVYGKARKEQYAWNVQARYNKKDFIAPRLSANMLLSYTYDNALTVDTVYRNYDWNGNYTMTSSNEITRRAKMLRRYVRPLTVARAMFNYEIDEHNSLNFNYMLTRNENRRTDDLGIDDDFTPSNDVMAKHIFGLTYNQSFFEGKMVNAFFLKDYLYYANIGQTDLSWITNYNAKDAETTRNNIGGGLGMRYKIGEPFALKLGYERAARLPQARELLGNGTTVMPNFKLQPEKSHNLNLGFFGNVKLDKQSAHSLQYEASAFLRKVDNYIYLVVSESEGMYQYNNVKSITVKGIEGELTYNYGRWLSLSANCSYQNSINMNRYKDDGKESVIYKNKLPNKPWLFSNVELQLTHSNLFSKHDRLRFRYDYQYVHWFYLTWEGFGSLDSKSRIPTQNLHSASLTYSWQKERYNMTLSCDNIYDSKAYDNFKLQKPGRSLMCKFRLFLN